MSLRYNAVSSLAFAAVSCHEVCARATKKKSVRNWYIIQDVTIVSPLQERRNGHLHKIALLAEAEGFLSCVRRLLIARGNAVDDVGCAFRGSCDTVF